MKYSVVNFMNRPQGARESFQLDAPFLFEEKDEPHVAERVKGNVQLLKLPHEINVQIRNLKTIAECVCSRCLKKFLKPLEVVFAEREFIIDLPQEEMGHEDVFYIDYQSKEIDLSDMVREELLLHFPVNPLCSEGCKGLCSQCGANLNKKKCSCTPVTELRMNPFKYLTR